MADYDYRYERKYTISSASVDDVIEIVNTHPYLFREIYYERTVNSVYFDTPILSSYYESLDGSPQKSKVRIRWYGDECEKSSLEIKYKNGSVGSKNTYKLEGFSTKGSLRKNYLEAIKKADIPKDIMAELKSLIPTTTNNFKRRYFISSDKKFRITIDYDLNFRRLLSSTFRTKNFIQANKGFVILEVKYDGKDNQELENVLRGLPFRISKFSKYSMGVASL
jgi:SPX domain protein involved in polyphosphate accumulation